LGGTDFFVTGPFDTGTPAFSLIERRSVKVHLLGTWDHASGIPLPIRQWAKVDTPLNVTARLIAVRALQQWAAENSRIEWIEATPFKPIPIGDYIVVPLPANHEAFNEPGMLPLITDGEAFVLWGTDTGPLPDETICALSTHSLDLVFLDKTWGDLAGASRIALLPWVPTFASMEM